MIASNLQLHYLCFRGQAHDWTVLNTCVCRGEREIKDKRLVPKLDLTYQYVSACLHDSNTIPTAIRMLSLSKIIIIIIIMLKIILIAPLSIVSEDISY